MDLSRQPLTFASLTQHSHIDGEICPTCEQVIPNDRLDHVKARHAEHQHEVESRYALRAKAEQDQLREQLRQEQREALAKMQQESKKREDAARADAHQAATVAMEAKVSAAATATAAANVQVIALQGQLEASAASTAELVASARAEERRVADAEAATKAVAAGAALAAARVQADDLKEQLKASTAAVDEKVAIAQAAARHEAEVALQPQLTAAQEATQRAQEQVRLHAEHEAAAHAQLGQLTGEMQAAVADKAAIEQQMQALRESQESVLRNGIQETREAMERASREALNAEQTKHFEEKQKIQNTVEDLQRQLENKTALELGEGAEIDLFETLRAAFPDDDITRIKRGLPGADIRHVVRHNGKACGLVLYDSKNHKSWRGDFITKLRDDQIADKADHAILATCAFPHGTRQVHMQDGVILVNPARAVAIAGLVRQQVVQAHCLCLSNEDREEKSLQLYSFITSERFATHLTKIQTTADCLLQLDVDEQTAHRKTWQKRGQLVNHVIKAQSDLKAEVERIVGTADEAVARDHAVAMPDSASLSS